MSDSTDLKKNCEAKPILCEKTEDILWEPLLVKAFDVLQKYHNQWRKVGLVPHETETNGSKKCPRHSARALCKR